MDFLKYDSLNIITNMFSLHIFVSILILRAFLQLISRQMCCKLPNWRILNRCRHHDASITNEFVSGGLRIFYTGFLEILLCSAIGLGVLKIGDEMTDIDVITAVVNVVYAVCLVVFCIILVWFTFFKSSPLIKFKKTRDNLEHLKVMKIIQDKIAEQEGLSKSTLTTSRRQKRKLSKLVSLEIDQFIKRTDTTRVKIADAMTKNVNNKARFDKIILARQELGQTQGAQAKIFDNAASLDDEIKQLSKQKK